MGIEVRMVIMSHLSDVQQMNSLNSSIPNETGRFYGQAQINKHINFVKRLLIRYKDNLNQEVNEDELNKIWSEISK